MQTCDAASQSTHRLANNFSITCNECYLSKAIRDVTTVSWQLSISNNPSLSAVRPRLRLPRRYAPYLFSFSFIQIQSSHTIPVFSLKNAKQLYCTNATRSVRQI